MIHAEHANDDPTAPDVGCGAEGVKRLIGTYRRASPDIRFREEEIFADGEGRVAHRWVFTGTHEAEIMGFGPTGKRVEVSRGRR